MTPIQKMVGRQIEVSQGCLSIVGVLMEMGEGRYRISYGAVQLNFTEAQVINYDKYSIRLQP